MQEQDSDGPRNPGLNAGLLRPVIASVARLFNPFLTESRWHGAAMLSVCGSQWGQARQTPDGMRERERMQRACSISSAVAGHPLHTHTMYLSYPHPIGINPPHTQAYTSHPSQPPFIVTPSHTHITLLSHPHSSAKAPAPAPSLPTAP